MLSEKFTLTFNADITHVGAIAIGMFSVAMIYFGVPW